MDNEHAIDAFSALAQPTRLAVFRLLMKAGPQGVAAGTIAERVGVPSTTLSTHLGILGRAGLIRSRRESRSIIYAVDLEGIRGLLAFLVQDCCNGHPDVCSPLVEIIEQARCGCAPEPAPRGMP